MIAEIAMAIDHHLQLGDLAATLHVYPTYAVGVQQLAADVRLRTLSGNPVVKLARRLSRVQSQILNRRIRRPFGKAGY
jgi:hypothetical protein